MPCSGDSTTICGGPDALQIYQNPSVTAAAAAAPAATSSAAASGPSTVASSGGLTSQGCIQEVSGRALRGTSMTSASMTIDMCVAYCTSNGYSMAGVEYAQECYCDNSLQGGASTSLVSGQCNMPCAGNANTICGGPNAINLYSK
jgi:hypothetical protein